MNKGRGRLGVKLGLIFLIFLIVTVILCGFSIYLSQTELYKHQSLENTKKIGDYLAGLIEEDGEDFIRYQEYYLAHYGEVDIPVDASEYLTYKTAYEEAFEKHHPGKTLDVDIEFEELDEEVQHAYLCYKHLYWLLTFEYAREVFNLPYSYYLILDSDTDSVIYIIDGERQSREEHEAFVRENPEYEKYNHYQGDEPEYMYLSDEYSNPREKYPIQWITWEKGEAQDEFQIWSNIWGDTYAYYSPVIVNGEKLGLVGVEVDINDVNTMIISNTIRQMSLITLVLVVTLIIMVSYVSKQYISKIIRLEKDVKEYSESKDPAVADAIEKRISGNDEIADLSAQIVGMIREIHDYINNLTQTNEALDKANDTAARMSAMAQRDPLTGIRNRNGYNVEMSKLEKEIKKGSCEFGIAMIDLNYLKVTNDTYGHEKGNIAIKKLSEIVCHVFDHSPVFRIGGDEFVVVLRNDDYRKRETLQELFMAKLQESQDDPTLEPWEKVSASIGIAIYEPARDKGTETVFKRADAKMYENKKEMKATRKI